MDLVANLCAGIRVAHHDGPLRAGEVVGLALDVGVALDRRGNGGKGLVRLKPHATRARYERITGDARARMVGAAKAPVDHEQLASCAYGLLAAFRLHRRVPVDDVPVFGLHAKFAQNGIARRCLAREGEVGVHGLFPRRLVLKVGALEGLHIAARCGGAIPDPQVPEPVERGAVAVAPGAACDAIAEVEVIAAASPGAFAIHAGEGTVFVHGNASVEEQVAVPHEIHRPMAEQELNMAAEVIGTGELRNKLIDDALLRRGKFVRVLGVEGREVARCKRPRAILEADGSRFKVDVLQKEAALHIEFRVALDDLSLQLEEQHVHRLHERRDALARAIGSIGERDELAQGDAVIVLEDLVVAVAQVVAQHRDDARLLARGRSHPEDIVVAPLDVQPLVRAEQQSVHDLRCPSAAVEDIAHQMYVVHREALDELGERRDEVFRRASFEDRVDDAFVVPHAVVVLVGMRVQELVDDIGVFMRDGLAHLGARVAARKTARHGDELVEHGLVPRGRIAVGIVHQGDFLVRIVDERAEVGFFLVGEVVAENLVNVLAHHARAVVEDVHERLVFAMEVAHEVLGALGQVKDGLEIDDLGEDRLLRGKVLG